MKVYVEELPKSCKECPCCSEPDFAIYSEYCEVLNEYVSEMVESEQDLKPKTCPLQSLSDYTKQVRKEVIGQVRDIARKIARPTTEYDDGEFDYDIDAITLGNLLIWLEDEEFDLLKNFLDQIQEDRQ